MNTNALAPFTIIPNPNRLYLTDSLKAVVQKSRFTINKRQGLSCILGDVGLGKSTILRYLWGEYSAMEDCKTVMIPTADYPSKYGMVKEICAEFGIEPMRSSQAQTRKFQEFLFEQYADGKNVILFIDEAQNLSNQQLEVLRTMLNFENNEVKTIQIVLAGQIELKAKLDHKKNKYLKSRIVMYSTLNPLTLNETKSMLEKRCEDADIENPFSDEVIEKIYVKSQGIPRSILKICSYLHELKMDYGLDSIPAEYVETAAVEVAL
jgi:general secretion pathway protein A